MALGHVRGRYFSGDWHYLGDVQATAAMAKSEAATGAADSTLTLGDALVLIRFEEDANALASLRRVIEAGNTGELFYYAERIRRDLARRQVSASVTAK